MHFSICHLECTFSVWCISLWCFLYSSFINKYFTWCKPSKARYNCWNYYYYFYKIFFYKTHAVDTFCTFTKVFGAYETKEAVEQYKITSLIFFWIHFHCFPCTINIIHLSHKNTMQQIFNWHVCSWYQVNFRMFKFD